MKEILLPMPWIPLPKKSAAIPEKCPACAMPRNNQGQPSNRHFFGCESYLYEGDTDLRDQTDLCRLRASMLEAWKLVNAMAGQEYWDRAKKWLEENKEFSPEISK